MKNDLGEKDIDISVAIGVTPATVSNWQNAKSIPRQKDVGKISKYFFIESKYKGLMAIDYINTYIPEIKDKISADKFNNILNAINNRKYSNAIFLILNSVCEEDRKNRNKGQNAAVGFCAGKAGDAFDTTVIDSGSIIKDGCNSADCGKSIETARGHSIKIIIRRKKSIRDDADIEPISLHLDLSLEG